MFNRHSDLPFLPERKEIEKCNKLVYTIQDKKMLNIRALKQALNYESILQELPRVIQFNQEAWLKPYTDMNTKLRKESKIGFEKDFFKLMNNVAFGKTMENVRKHRDIKLVTTDKRRDQLVSEPNYYTTKYFSENLMAIEMKKKLKMIKLIYLSISIRDISKTLLYEFWYDFIKPKYQYKTKLSYMDTDSFVIYIKPKIFTKILLMMLKMV